MADGWMMDGGREASKPFNLSFFGLRILKQNIAFPAEYESPAISDMTSECLRYFFFGTGSTNPFLKVNSWFLKNLKENPTTKPIHFSSQRGLNTC